MPVEKSSVSNIPLKSIPSKGIVAISPKYSGWLLTNVSVFSWNSS
ncbi:hypothetical protein OMAG_000826 [Candidatus Omnitrophus magneticus]|uniref:Uncharacterized protein n=1 Tax=Candidatus Omnitrophus magneticus TaxID=1609969 RepID=A0A0F0CM66_9BACT|nr:hypothetical protein OMAG_001965 [Candidatus Omnitrophus magneticus]KJJ84423.1 hypothetical protein OMAG_001714 [Candidatus Omnitrophus magneticus]KJJ85287.1 hypothetical protein OMAG_000852 [Candidatus Omnitrophus magneticus]KJJ85311.1 hypothetical protein OMAG_000826 [Candidatus Omnitrophus magneticus]